VIDPIGGVGTGASVISLLWQALDAVKGKDSIRSLVAKELRAAHDIDAPKRAAVAEVWTSQRVDYDLGGALLAWLATGDPAHAARAVERWRELLAGNRELGLTVGEIETITAVTAASLRDNFARAQPDEIAAIHAEAERMLHAIDASARAIDELTARVDELLALARPAPHVGRVRFNLPAVAAVFKGRDTELGLIDKALKSDERAVVTQAIAGLGGVGKSQLAARYVQLHTEEYEIVAWISAQDAGIADLARLADRVGIADSADASPADRAQSVIAWLGECEHSWLLVLDNVDSAAQLNGLLPRGSAGRMLVTSRDRTLSQFGPLLTVDVFDEDTATDYLVVRANRAGDEQAARELGRALGFLPLALAHAGAYCAEGVSFAEYHAQLTGLPAPELFDTHPEVFYEQTVASTWKPSIAAATQAAALAADVLELAAFLAPDKIPKDLFDVLVDAPGETRERRRLNDACNALARYSLATADDDTIGVHRLLQRVIRDELDAAGDRTPASRALGAVWRSFPSDTQLPTQWPVCEQLLRHALTLAETWREPGDDARRIVELLGQCCTYLIFADAGRRALAIAEVAYQHGRRLLGADDHATLNARGRVAAAYRTTGSPGDAIAIFLPLIDDYERMLGAEHPDTLQTRHGLASAYFSGRRPGDAIEIYEPLLIERERLLGAEHHNTLSTRHNLALAYLAVRRTDEAIEIYEGLLAYRKRVLGSEHPSTLGARNNLAIAYQEAGRTENAISIYEPLLADVERVIGAEHPDTLKTRICLADAYRVAGREDAIVIHEALLADVERLLGSEHPDTLGTRNNLALAYRDGGRSADAVEIYEQLLTDRERLLGAEHSDTLAARHGLADSYRAAGRLDEAERLDPGE